MKILYPFSIDSYDESSFLATMELAKKEQAEVTCFTAVEEVSALDEAYLQLLKLFGSYQIKMNNWQATDINFSKIIEVGNLEDSLVNYISNENFDYVIYQDASPKLNTTFLKQFLSGIAREPNVISFE